MDSTDIIPEEVRKIWDDEREFHDKISEIYPKAFLKNEIEHIIDQINELNIIKIKYFYIISPACQIFKFIFKNKTMLEYSFVFLDKIDEILMSIPLLTKLSWIEVFVSENGEK